MTILRVQCNIPNDTLLPEDDAINTWHFLTVGAATPADAADDALIALGVFYAAADTYLSGGTATPMRYKVYDLENDEPRVPILEATQTLTPSASINMPNEVACCISYRGEFLSGANPARRRGRIFIGPLNNSGGTSATGDFRPSSTLRTGLANAASDIIVAGQTADARWVVFSPTLAGAPPWSAATLEAASCDVTAGYIDDAFDTVRSRGLRPTTRTVFSEILP